MVANEVAVVRPCPVPDHQQGLFQMAFDRLEELDKLFLLDAAFVNPEQEVDTSQASAVGTPETAIDLESQMMAHMPERAVLEAISNTEHWAQWGRHFGLPSRLGPQIKDASHRYVLTTFAYGCGLGPTEAARHLGESVSADQLAFVDRRHVDIEDLRAASADLINLYARFELSQQWGTGQSAAADGTHFETYEDNLLAEPARVKLLVASFMQPTAEYRYRLNVA